MRRQEGTYRDRRMQACTHTPAGGLAVLGSLQSRLPLPCRHASPLQLPLQLSKVQACLPRRPAVAVLLLGGLAAAAAPGGALLAVGTALQAGRRGERHE
jgi:hypothetical protein